MSDMMQLNACEYDGDITKCMGPGSLNFFHGQLN